MIPEKFIEFAHGPSIMFVGSRNAKLRPTMTFAFGALVDGGEATVTVFIPEIEGAKTFENLAENGRTSLVLVDAASHESYQFKGQHRETRPCTDADYTVQEIYLSKLIAHLEPFGYGEDLWNGFVHRPARAVTFAVEDIFVQSPGPGAGEKIELS
ncbi:MAG: pyridoxamine 5'-phosphate oxidase family protein [Alphaproteobacteria bacterium]|nr:pyridoxamine 5'-phosphate oxidase family protein [Alphaproteobacteria bacterium]MDP6588101.1 pyridoxamine 5'-phosphate oxidase family protein [Alphaproteobacteria bacterium]MDP6816778.1 pyridoxamine 5'-phosphate oxidase family protein [Alphaproteobacteria bacterium]